MKLSLPLTVAAACLVTCHFCQAQDGGLMHRPAAPRAQGDLTLTNSSLIFRPIPEKQKARALQLHDVITVIVDERSRVLSEGDVETRKRASLNATLQDWILFRNGNLKPSPQSDGSPTVNGSLTEQYRAEADIESRDTMTFRMAAEIVDILPNGNLVIEGHKHIENNAETWVHSLTGIVKRESIQDDGTVKSDEILHLRIRKREAGQVRDGYRRGWAKKFYDRFFPF